MKGLKNNYLNLLLLGFCLLPRLIFATSPKEHFMTTVQLEIQEPSPALQYRAQQLILKEFNDSFRAWPTLQNKRYQIKKKDNEIIFSLLTANNIDETMQRVVGAMVRRLEKQVRFRGRHRLYRTSLENPMNNYLDVAVYRRLKMEPSQPRLRFIKARGIPLRDILMELQHQLGPLSYLVPSDCAARTVDWNFTSPSGKPRLLEDAMREIAILFNLKYKKRRNSHIFIGNCQHLPQPRAAIHPLEATDIIFLPPPSNTVRLPGNVALPTRQIVFPVIPLRH